MSRHLARYLVQFGGAATVFSERDLMGLVELRPVGGITTWRSPVAAILAARTPHPLTYWFGLIEQAFASCRCVAVSTRGDQVLLRLGGTSGVGAARFASQCAAELRLWDGPAETVTLGVCEGWTPQASAGPPDAACIVGQSLAAMISAAGDQVRWRSAPPFVVEFDRADCGVTYTLGSIHVVDAAVLNRPGAEGDEAAGEELVGLARLGSTSVRIALLSASGPHTRKVRPWRQSGPDLDRPVDGDPSQRVPGASLSLSVPDLLARTDRNRAFLLVHALHVARRRARAGPGRSGRAARGYAADGPGAQADSALARGSGGQERELWQAVAALAAYPFVVEKSARRGDPTMLVGHLVTLARAVERTESQPVCDALAQTLEHGLTALAVQVPTRI